MAQIFYEAKKPSLRSRAWNWIKEHQVGIVTGGVLTATGIAGYLIGRSSGYSSGKAEGIRETLDSVSGFFKEDYPRDVEVFGQIGADTVYDYIVDNMPDLKDRLYSDVCWGEIADLYFSDPYVHKALESSKFLAEAIKK